MSISKVPIIIIKSAVEYMQLCQFHFYQKIARKKVARVNAALEPFERTEFQKLEVICKN